MAPKINFEGKHIFIAGGSRGIGAASAKMLAETGAEISLTYQNSSEKAQEVAAIITSNGGQAQIFQMTMENEGSVTESIDQAVDSFGNLHGLVVSAGIFEHCLIEDMTPEFWERTISINLSGTVWCVKAAAKHMRAQDEGGAMVIYSPTAGQSGGGGGASAYAVSKAGQIMFVRCMAHELAGDQIRVNTIAPAWTETDMAAPHLERLGRDNVAPRFPLGRIGQPDDVASATCYLLSDLAKFVTGTVHTVDGGMAMRG
ncbi:MAG: SDR family oxidoreductase [Candidatus Latescibacteria bacterium]|nr:SDR family oxidoreductase [Candidatus Latescibacterota bacterium]